MSDNSMAIFDGTMGCLRSIRTRRFLLRDFVAEDISAFREYHSDPRLREFFPADESDSNPDELLEAFMGWSKYKPRVNYQLAIVARDSPSSLIGCAGIRSVDSSSQQAEIGIELAPRYWGRNRYAIEILFALAEFAFRELKLRGLYGISIDANQRLGRLVSAIGASSIVATTPEWMQAKDWRQVQWQLSHSQWLLALSRRIVSGLVCEVEYQSNDIHS